VRVEDAYRYGRGGEAEQETVGGDASAWSTQPTWLPEPMLFFRASSMLCGWGHCGVLSRLARYAIGP
jgi:hypothetical protein